MKNKNVLLGSLMVTALFGAGCQPSHKNTAPQSSVSQPAPKQALDPNSIIRVSTVNGRQLVSAYHVHFYLPAKWKICDKSLSYDRPDEYYGTINIWPAGQTGGSFGECGSPAIWFSTDAGSTLSGEKAQFAKDKTPYADLTFANHPAIRFMVNDGEVPTANYHIELDGGGIASFSTMRPEDETSAKQLMKSLEFDK